MGASGRQIEAGRAAIEVRLPHFFGAVPWVYPARKVLVAGEVKCGWVHLLDPSSSDDVNSS